MYSSLEKLRCRRAVRGFSGFPKETALIYLRIASCYPWAQVYAVGSRVRGDYADGKKKTTEARSSGGKANKWSDYDYWVVTDKAPVHRLPEGADHVRCRVPAHEKIAIPMWDFSKLPASEHVEVRRLLCTNDLVALVRIHDKYRLSDNVYCCDLISAQRWFSWGVENGLIK
jgi:predicted nucleotidyltransferase